MAMEVRKRAWTYHAVVYTGTNIDEVKDFIGARYVTVYNSGLVNAAPMVMVQTDSGAVTLSTGDAVVKSGASIEVYSAAQFADRFEPVPVENRSTTIVVDPIGGGVGVNRES